MTPEATRLRTDPRVFRQRYDLEAGRRELTHILEEGLIGKIHQPTSQIRNCHSRIDLKTCPGGDQNRLDLRREVEIGAVLVVVQRLLAEAIARYEEFLLH